MERTHRMLAAVQVAMLEYTTARGWDGGEVIARLERIETYLIERMCR